MIQTMLERKFWEGGPNLRRVVRIRWRILTGGCPYSECLSRAGMLKLCRKVKVVLKL